ncbi:MAG: succinyl-diaminopimelate desuccinylase [Cellvibrionaceae bacterium]|jgi:succinyl-diaminopimelate desuccinylase
MTIDQLAGTEQAELVSLLQRLIQFPTEDPPGREIEMAQFLCAILKDWGIPAEMDEFLPNRANVIGRVKGDGSQPALIFSAHIDTMTVGTRPWDHDPFAGEIEDGKLYGRGASDMKSGMAAMMMAAKRLAEAGHPLKGDLILAFTAGESSNCLGARRMIETGQLSDAGAIIVSEPSSLQLLVAEAGTWWVKAVAKGETGHGSGVQAGTKNSLNAIIKLVDFIQKLQFFSFDVPSHPLLGQPTINIGLIAGGTAVNQTPDYAECAIDVRFLPNMDADEMQAALQKFAGDEIAFETIDLKPAIELPTDHPLVTLCEKVCHDKLGTTAPPGGVFYYSDAVIFTPALNIPRVILGPGELGMSGSRDEYVEIEKLVKSAEIFQQIAIDYLS